MPGTDTLQEAAQAVDAGFSRTERPPNEELLHPRCADDGDLRELYEVEDWREMSDELVVNNYAAPSFLSAAGFQYFLPAFISYALRNPESPEFVIEWRRAMRSRRPSPTGRLSSGTGEEDKGCRQRPPRDSAYRRLRYPRRSSTSPAG